MKIDFTYLETLSDGDASFTIDFIRTFEETAYTLTQKMMEELKANDRVSLGKTAHQLKPSAKMLSLECGDKLEEIQNNPEIANEEMLKSIHNDCIAAIDKAKEWARGNGVEI